MPAEVQDLIIPPHSITQQGPVHHLLGVLHLFVGSTSHQPVKEETFITAGQTLTIFFYELTERETHFLHLLELVITGFRQVT